MSDPEADRHHFTGLVTHRDGVRRRWVCSCGAHGRWVDSCRAPLVNQSEVDSIACRWYSHFFREVGIPVVRWPTLGSGEAGDGYVDKTEQRWGRRAAKVQAAYFAGTAPQARASTNNEEQDHAR